MIPLFKRFPALAEALPYEALADLPTPVRSCAALGVEAKTESLHVKCDDVTGADYGGNKVRKLAFLLAQARKQGATSTLTFGAAGSNHALATAIYARKLGFQPISMLVPQYNAHSVRRNLLRGLAAGASLNHFERRLDVARGTIGEIFAARRAGEPRPFIIPAGGSAPLGTVGFVNAGLELHDQIVEGELPAPDTLYVASGTMGTCVGLLIGLQLAGLDMTVMAVAVTSPPYTSMEKARRLFARTVGLLRKADPNFPTLVFPEAQFCLREDYLGESYARYTKAGVTAVAQARELADIALEGTYTGKAMACLLGDGESGHLAGKKVLFWNTYNSVSQESAIKDIDYHQLSAPFHRYYEEAVQELDRVEG